MLGPKWEEIMIDQQRLRRSFVAVILLFAFVLFPVRLAHAGLNRWTTHGPEGANVSALVVDPINSTTLYAGTSGGGVFKSTNGGTTWEAASNGLGSPYVHRLLINPVTPTTLYAGTADGFFKSIDGGRNWSAILTGFPPEPAFPTANLAIDPVTPTTLYLGTSSRGILKSTDEGRSWVVLGTTPQPYSFIESIAIDPSNPRTFYVGAFQPACGRNCPPVFGAFKSTDGGTTWQQITVSPNSFGGFRFAPQPSGIVYAYGFSGLFRSNDGGNNWQPLNNGLDGILVNTLIVSPTTPTTLFVGTGQGLLQSTDDGNTWLPIGPNGVGINTIAIDPNNPQILYLGSGGVFKSTDGGKTWQLRTTGLHAVSITGLIIDPLTPTSLYAYTGASLFTSRDASSTWITLNTLPEGTFFRTLTLAPTTPTTLYAYTWSGNATLGPAFLKSVDGGKSWQSIFVNTFVPAFAVDPLTPTTLYAVISRPTNEGSLVTTFEKSVNGGSSWIPLNFNLDDTGVGGITVHPVDPAVLYISTTKGIFTSRDGGASWSLLSSALIGNIALVFDPQTPTTMYAYGPFGGQQISKSVDGGTTWSVVLDGPPQFSGLPGFNTTVLVIDPKNPTTLYAGFSPRLGILKSTDGGKSWVEMNTGLVNTDVSALVIDPRSGETLYAGTNGGSVFDFQIGNEPADLSITMSDSPDPIETDNNLTYTFPVTNNGPSGAAEVTIRNAIPSGVTLVSATPSQGTCSGQNIIVCELGTLAAGQTVTITIIVKVPLSTPVGEMATAASVSSSEPDPRTDNNTATIVTTVIAAPGPDLTGYWGSVKQKCKEKAGVLRCTLKGTFVVQNVGTRDAPSSTVSLAYSCRDCSEFVRLTVPPLKSGKRKKLKWRRTYEGRAFGLPIEATIDPDNSILEMDEQNNWTLSAPIQ
jgi:uncharacterized repeat protein (TIGR01451 family)